VYVCWYVNNSDVNPIGQGDMNSVDTGAKYFDYQNDNKLKKTNWRDVEMLTVRCPQQIFARDDDGQ
jgi:hypothetical protein